MDYTLVQKVEPWDDGRVRITGEIKLGDGVLLSARTVEEGPDISSIMRDEVERLAGVYNLEITGSVGSNYRVRDRQVG